ncbi:hypothetical protein [Ilumatobacter coccineus]|uniref:Uncharacterized protein n=1 Tax=Ilumatobacter coccineus (strain NBRC 103263 / KCTC 29153 / YM16-304) TaxID=1313172 RepID=A0A6C7EA68_ILUCY|nr:hypothetical protein [Ilumatobacter coccineus]BAN03627.1 hypothetical protein YM304_33130 [Ilumatobacter coccineus YM16-304]
MTRRRLTILLPLAAALLAGGCTTFSDADAVARVGDVELSVDDLDALAVDAGIPAGEDLPPDVVRTLIQNWVQETAVRDGLLDPNEIDISEAAIGARFDSGLTESGVVCPAIVVTDTPEIAVDAAAELDAGAEFADVFAEQNIDTTLDSTTGQIGCVDILSVLQAADAPEVGVLLDLSGDDRYGSSALTDQLGTPVGGIVVAFRTYDELADTDRSVVDSSIRSVFAVEEIDIMIDSRYGYFDPITTSIQPLGG